MTDAELARLLFANPELQVATEPDARPMPPAAREWLQADKAKLTSKFLALWELCGGPELQPEYRFDEKRLWRFDFVHLDTHTAIELEGGVWASGRHLRGNGYLADVEKYNAAQMAGYVVLRLGTGQVDMQHVSELVEYVRGRM